jgi:hypothetical protein
VQRRYPGVRIAKRRHKEREACRPRTLLTIPPDRGGVFCRPPAALPAALTLLSQPPSTAAAAASSRDRDAASSPSTPSRSTPLPGRSPHDVDATRPAGHARAPGGGRPSLGAPRDDLVAGATVALAAAGRREWRRNGDRGHGGCRLHEVLLPATTFPSWCRPC